MWVLIVFAVYSASPFIYSVDGFTKRSCADAAEKVTQVSNDIRAVCVEK